MTRCQTSSVTSRNGSGLLKPALLNITSRPSNAVTHASIIRRMSARWDTSPAAATAEPPDSLIAVAACSAPDSSMSATHTLAPSAARRSAMPRPMPCAAPVTTIRPPRILPLSTGVIVRRRLPVTLSD